jgi:NitT/TauT family transport system substrate-binding protein
LIDFGARNLNTAFSDGCGNLKGVAAKLQGDCASPAFKMDSRPKNRHDAKGNSIIARPVRKQAMCAGVEPARRAMACVLLVDPLVSNVRSMMRAGKMRVVSMSNQFRISVAAAAIIAGSATAALANEAVTFGTNWLAEAEHGGYYQAVADGTYAACGLDVTIMQGGPQVSGRPLLLAGKIQFYMGGNMLQAFDAVQQNIPLRVVAADFQKEPQVLMSQPGHGLDKFEDLKNAEQYIIGDEGAQSFLLWLAVEHGFDVSKRVPYTYNPAPFIANPKSIQQGYVTSEPFAVEKEGGFKPNVFLLADNGFSTYATTIETMQDTIDKKPDVVKCFVEGSAKGWYNYLYGDNKAANELIKKDNPDMNDDQLAFSGEQLKHYGIVDSGDTEKLGIGAMTDARVQDFYDKMVKAKVLPEGIDIKKAYTLDFVNKGVGLDLKK